MKLLKKIKAFFSLTGNHILSWIENTSDKLLLVFLCSFYLLWRILSAPMFEFSGDAVFKWSILRYFRETGIWYPLMPEHHQGRWCQNIPVYGCMKLFDSSSPWIGMIIPVLTGLVTLILIYLITRKIASKTSAALACFSMMTFSAFINESAQFLPSLPAAMYTLLALYLLICYIETPRKLSLTLLAGFIMGLAWGCKVTSIYWCAGIGLFLLFHRTGGKDIFCRKNFRIGWDAVLFSIGFLFVLIPETILLNEHFGLTFGRIDMLRAHHGDNPNLVSFNLFEYMLSPFFIFLDFSGKGIVSIPFAMLFLLFPFVLFFRLRDKECSLSERFLLFTLMTAGLIHCYFVVRIFPFKHPERPLIRYFMTLEAVTFILLFASGKYWKKLREHIFPAFVFCAVFILMVISAIAGFLNGPLVLGDHLFNKIHSYRCLELRRKENLPMLVAYHKGTVFNNRVFKIVCAWRTFNGKTSDLPSMGNRKKLREILSQEKPVRAQNGKLYFLVCGPRPSGGAKAKCIVVNEEHLSVETLSIAEEAKAAVLNEQE